MRVRCRIGFPRSRIVAAISVAPRRSLTRFHCAARRLRNAAGVLVRPVDRRAKALVTTAPAYDSAVRRLPEGAAGRAGAAGGVGARLLHDALQALQRTRLAQPERRPDLARQRPPTYDREIEL